jgi:hypothetical protein
MSSLLQQVKVKWFESLIVIALSSIVTVGAFYIGRIRYLASTVEYHHDLRNVNYDLETIPEKIVPTKNLASKDELNCLSDRVLKLERESNDISIFREMFIASEAENAEYINKFQITLWATQNNRNTSEEPELYINLSGKNISFLSFYPINSKVVVFAVDDGL